MKKGVKYLIALVVTTLSLGVSFGESVKAESSVESSIASLFQKVTSSSSESAKLSIPVTVPSSGIYDPSEYLNEDVYGALVAFNQAWWENENGNHPQLGIVFIDSLNSNNIEEVANETSRNWKIGSSEDNLGILLLVAVEDRVWRVEVSDKLGGVLTDSQAYGLGDSMKSDFRYKDYSNGVITFITGLNKTLANGYGEPVVDLGYGDGEVDLLSAAQVLFSVAFITTCAICVLVVMYRVFTILIARVTLILTYLYLRIGRRLELKVIIILQVVPVLQQSLSITKILPGGTMTIIRQALQVLGTLQVGVAEILEVVVPLEVGNL